MKSRRGLGRGRGKGYKNIIRGYDSKVHTDSARGRKQPQRIYPSLSIAERRKVRQVLENVDAGRKDQIDLIESKILKALREGRQLKKDVIQGKISIQQYEKRQEAISRLIKGIFKNDSDGDGVPNDQDCNPNDPTKQDFTDEVFEPIIFNKFPEPNIDPIIEVTNKFKDTDNDGFVDAIDPSPKKRGLF